MTRVHRKKKAGEQASVNSNKRPRPAIDLALRQQDERIDSDDEEDSHDDFKQQQEPSLHEEESEEEEEEAPDVKRVRLARQYLETIDARPEDEESSSDESSHDEQPSGDEDDRIGRKLQRDRLKREGTLERALANKVQRRVTEIQESIAYERPAFLPPPEAAKEWVRQGHVHLLRGHDLTPTSVALQGQYILSGSKDHSVILWDAQAKSRLRVLNQAYNKKHDTEKHDNENNKLVSRTEGQVLAVALSDDGRFAVVGKRSGKVEVYDARSAAKTDGANQSHHLKTLEGHKGAVTCVAFRTQSNQLFSGSEDRCIRHYNLDEMLYMETLYGHQFGVTAMDCHRKERPISVGRDRTARAWKLAEDTHLIFRGGSKIQSAECIAVIKDDWFLTGHESGHLNLWLVDKKRAVASIENAHGPGHGVVSVGCCKGSDIAATGSNDGYLRFWKVKTGLTMEERGLEPLCQIPVFGYINAIAFETKSRFCVLAVGQEHRSGRWDRVKRAKNRIAIVSLRSSSDDDNESDGESAKSENDPKEDEDKVADTDSSSSDESDSSDAD